MKSRDTLIRLKKFQVDEKRRKVMQIETMIAEFERMASDLEREIKRLHIGLAVRLKNRLTPEQQDQLHKMRMDNHPGMPGAPDHPEPPIE